jgi:hypothetical protein
MNTPTSPTKPAAVQFTNAAERSTFILAEVDKTAVRMGLNRTTDYTKIFNEVLREHPELADAAKRSSSFTNASSTVLTGAEKAQFLNAEIDSLAAARGMDSLQKLASGPALRKEVLGKRPELALHRSADAACDRFSKPPPSIGSPVCSIKG